MPEGEFPRSRVKGFTIGHKGLVLISIPVVFILLFVGLVTLLKRSTEQAHTRSMHSREVLALTRAMSKNLTDAAVALRNYLGNADRTLVDSHDRALAQIPESFSKLQAIVQDSPEQTERARLLGEKLHRVIGLYGDVMRLLKEGKRDEATELPKRNDNKQLVEEFKQDFAFFLAEEERLDVERQLALDRSWKRLNWLLIGGAAAAVLITVLLSLIFTKGISKRLMVLTDNAERLARGEVLAPSMGGSDEIAHLDRVFHKMATVLDEASRKERAVVRHALDVICSVDAEGKFINVSPACLRLWGYTPEELIGRRYIELVAPEDVERTTQAAERIISGESMTDFENRYVHKSGSLVNVMWTATWSEVDQLIFAVARDTTERRRAEDTIRELNRTLEKQAAQLTVTNNELEAFSYSVSHDLRAPLRHIHGFADLLKKHAGQHLDEKGQRYVGIISQSAAQLGQLIDDLLSFSRMGRAELQSTLINTEALVQHVLEALRGDWQGRKVTFQNGNLPPVHADPAMFRQVLTNLLSNALKYSSTREEAIIELGSNQDDPNETVIFVRDNGVGFDMRYVDKLFGVFQRLHGPDEFAGTGIGLANVRRIINRHGGRTWAEGAVGEGATFYFSLPRPRKDNQ
jgi:PAS domain S-box-containing protein